MTFALYPYVYLLARTALLERAGGLMEAARLLGASWPRRVREVALPLARPAVAAGVAALGAAAGAGIRSNRLCAWLRGAGLEDHRLGAGQLRVYLDQRCLERILVVGEKIGSRGHAQHCSTIAVIRGAESDALSQ